MTAGEEHIYYLGIRELPQLWSGHTVQVALLGTTLEREVKGRLVIPRGVRIQLLESYVEGHPETRPAFLEGIKTAKLAKGEVYVATPRDYHNESVDDLLNMGKELACNLFHEGGRKGEEPDFLVGILKTMK